jgi:hypothetical protein
VKIFILRYGKTNKHDSKIEVTEEKVMCQAHGGWLQKKPKPGKPGDGKPRARFKRAAGLPGVNMKNKSYI